MALVKSNKKNCTLHFICYLGCDEGIFDAPCKDQMWKPCPERQNLSAVIHSVPGLNLSVLWNRMQILFESKQTWKICSAVLSAQHFYISLSLLCGRMFCAHLADLADKWVRFNKIYFFKQAKQESWLQLTHNSYKSSMTTPPALNYILWRLWRSIGTNARDNQTIRLIAANQ